MNRIISIVFVLSAILLPIAEGYSQNATLFSTPAGIASITPADYPPLAKPAMRWATEMEYSKDPSVIQFQGKYWLYFSQPPKIINGKKHGWTTGIAQSDDLTHWTFVTNLLPIGPGEMEIGAPCVKVINNRVYMFYQTWQKNDYRHTLNLAVSDDGIHFTPSPVQPAFKPSGDWNTNRVIDADYIETQDGRRFLYGATREPSNKIQQLVVATAPAGTDLLTAKWTQACEHSVVKPEFPWETRCIEAPSVIERSEKRIKLGVRREEGGVDAKRLSEVNGSKEFTQSCGSTSTPHSSLLTPNSILYMFYGGGYNNHPQHIGVAVSTDGINWVKLWTVPFITNGPKGQWNASESGHPGIFEDENGQTWLFYQGNCTGGKDWYLSRVKIGWRTPKPEEFNADVLAKYPNLKNVQVPFVELEESPSDPKSDSDPKSGKTLVWSDEFDYPDAQLDENWIAENASPSHIICSRWRENVVVKDGTVRLNNKKEQRGGKNWTSASIGTKKEFCYGYFECRYRYAAATGTNNSFWLMTRNRYAQVTDTKPTSDSKDATNVPPSACPFEIDINEGHYPSEINTNIHNWGKNHQTFHKAFEQDKSMDLSKEFHTYGLLWTPTELVFYFDGKELRREENKFCHIPAPIYLSEAIFEWAGTVTDAIDGTFMEVDYVRVYQ